MKIKISDLLLKKMVELEYANYKDKHVSFVLNGKTYSGIFNDASNVLSQHELKCSITMNDNDYMIIPRDTELTFPEDVLDDDMKMIGGKRHRRRRYKRGYFRGGSVNPPPDPVIVPGPQTPPDTPPPDTPDNTPPGTPRGGYKTRGRKRSKSKRSKSKRSKRRSKN